MENLAAASNSDYRQKPSIQVFPPVQGRFAVGSHSEPRVCVVPQMERAVVPSLTLLQSGVLACEAHAVWLGLSHET